MKNVHRRIDRPLVLVFAAALLFLAAGVFAMPGGAVLELDDETGCMDVASWDRNEDDIIDRTEFHAGFGNEDLFADWAGDDDFIDREEFERGFDDNEPFDDWDDNRDGFFDENESRFADDDFSRWDRDSDQRLSTDEINEGLFDDWDRDRDERLSQEELSEGFFSLADEDADDQLSRTELENHYLFDRDWSFETGPSL
ncbi:MAG TPA: hypothetical protein VMT85_16520 [Thermoanaerobaculia bacterium]|nr:hypothetical protein [Thermoanaerobaculia bacterium]